MKISLSKGNDRNKTDGGFSEVAKILLFIVRIAVWPSGIKRRKLICCQKN